MNGVPTDPKEQHAARSSLRVAIVTETYPPEVNGVAMTMARIVDGLRERRHRVQLIRPRQHGAERPGGRPGLEEVLVRGVPIPRYDALKIGMPARRALLRLWSLQPPDVVHVVTEGPLGWSALAAARRLKLPVCADFHTNFHTYTRHYGIGWLHRPISAYLRRFHNKAQANLVPTRQMRIELEQLGMRNLRVVARGVDTALFSPRRRNAQLRASWAAVNDDPVALYVGRIAPEKNLPLVLEAFEAMKQRNSRLRLVLVGDGPDRAALQSAFPGCVFAGMRHGEDLATHYASADIFLFPSTSETYGNVTVEAMASGLAVLAYDYAAAAEHIRHGTSGLLARLHDAGEFTALAAALARDPGHAAHLGANARLVTEKLDWAWIVRDFERALFDVAGLGGLREPAPRPSA